LSIDEFPFSFTSCKIGEAHPVTFEFQGKQCTSEPQKCSFNVSWAGAHFFVSDSNVRLLRVEVIDLNKDYEQVNVRGCAIIDLGKGKPGDWQRIPILKEIGSKEVTGEIEYGAPTVEDPVGRFKLSEGKKEIFAKILPYLGKEDRATFFSPSRNVDDDKNSVVELYYHIATDRLAPLKSPAWKAFGFRNCRSEEERNLMALFKGLAFMGVGVDEFYKAWMADDLVGLIERTYEQKYAKNKDSAGWYYNVWFPQNKDKIGRNQPVGCKVCGKTKNTKRCTQCTKVLYCSKEHQVADWKNHKEFCKNEKASPFVIQL